MAAPKRKLPVKRRPRSRAGRERTQLRWAMLVAGVALIMFIPLYYGYVIKTATATWRWLRDAGQEQHYHNYKSFNIRIPDKYSIHGIDISYYQGKIDWQRVKKMHEGPVHITFTFIKATEGVLITDPYFQRNWRESQKAGIICGAYHYFRPRASGKWQAKFFLQNVKTKSGNLPMVIDVEELDGKQPGAMRQELKSCLDYIELRTGIRPMIYSGLSFYQDYLNGYFDDYTLWIAHYYQPQLKISASDSWKFWQQSDKATVNGINHVVDFDVFGGDSLAFKKLLVP